MLREKRSTTEDTADTEGRKRCIERYLYPEPRLRLGTLLGRNRLATACIDLSDGLADGVRQIAVASGVGAVIDADALPIEADVRHWFASRHRDAIDPALTGGDDYELLFSVKPRATRELHNVCRSAGVAVTRIGACTADRQIVLRGASGSAPWPRGYSHFR